MDFGVIMSEKTVKETKELMEGVQLIAITAVKIADNGFDIKEDFKHVIDLAKNANVLVEAVKGMGDIDEEVKDLDQQELAELGLLVFNMYKNVKAAKAEVEAARAK